MATEIRPTRSERACPDRTTPRRRALIALGGCVAVGLLWAGCSVERDYKLLSFFFDGVPDPTLVKNAEDALRFAKETGGTVYSHAPYVNNQCAECHKNLAGEEARQVNPEICFRCHEAVTHEHASMHGAVAAGACVYCHSPHESTFKHLLRGPSPAICAQCHTERSFGSRRAPVHQDLSQDCLGCHSGHGGPERFFLQPGWLERVPKQTPADAPAPRDASATREASTTRDASATSGAPTTSPAAPSTNS